MVAWQMCSVQHGLATAEPPWRHDEYETPRGVVLAYRTVTRQLQRPPWSEVHSCTHQLHPINVHSSQALWSHQSGSEAGIPGETREGPMIDA